MTFYDIVMLVVFIGAVLHGYWKGLAWQVASVAAIVVGYVVSMNFRGQVAPLLPIEEPWDRIAAMLILFLASSLGVWIAYAMVTKSMENLELKGFDRQAGALVGGITGALLCMVISMFSVSFFGDQAVASIRDSRLAPYIVTGIDRVSSIIPPEMAQYVHRYVEDWNEAKPQIESGLPTGETTPVYPSSPFTPASNSQNWTDTQQASFNQSAGTFPNNGRPSLDNASTDPNDNRVWNPPKIEINIDSEEALNSLKDWLKKNLEAP
jgi:uncharacterized membrane protein required for colicin V production